MLQHCDVEYFHSFGYRLIEPRCSNVGMTDFSLPSHHISRELKLLTQSRAYNNLCLATRLLTLPHIGLAQGEIAKCL